MTRAELTPTDRTRLRRKADRAVRAWSDVEAILDEGLVAHVGVVSAHGPIVLPMAYGRVGSTLYLHGASANALLHDATAADLCVTVTLLDGLVLARSTFHHSMNYRSVVIFGRGVLVEDETEKEMALAALVEQVVPGRTADARSPTGPELRATRVLRVALDEASAKARTGPPADDDGDLALPIWAGEIPLRTVAGAPVVDRAGMQVDVPAYAAQYARPGWT